jgi:protein TonB
MKKTLLVLILLIPVIGIKTKTKPKTIHHKKTTPAQEVIFLESSIDKPSTAIPASEEDSLHKGKVDVQPEFPGGNQELMKYLNNNIRYPDAAVTNEVEGRLLTSFEVCTDGSICNIKIEKSLYPACDEEAIRVIKKMPNWKPAILQGKPVRTIYKLPFVFKMQ